MNLVLVHAGQAVLSGVLVGCVYGLFSIGFSLAFGVMRIVNFAHGMIVMLGMYLGYFVFGATGLDLIISIPAGIIAGAALGAVLYELIYQPFVGKATLLQLLVAIATGLILQMVAQIAFGPDVRSLRLDWQSGYLLLGPFFLSYSQIVAAAVAIFAVIIVHLLLRMTLWGQAVRAVADDIGTAELVGINSQWVNIGAFALACALGAVAGVVLVTYYPVNPSIGFSLMPIALIATVIGGLGSVGGAFLGGVICGVIEQLTGIFWTTALQDIPLYVLLLVFLVIRPNGLLGRAAPE
jgi:branched-chain amino acid transport system permease protein